MEVDRYEHGVPSWIDLGTTDLSGAKAFYSSIFGWTIQEGPPEAGGYCIAEIRGRPVAGIGPQMNPAAPPAWMTYVNVESADSVADLVRQAGGQVLAGPFDVLDVGRMAVFADPLGAVIGIWQPRSHLGAGLVNEPNTYCWSELVTTDLDRSKAFYRAVFGWEATGSEQYTEWQVAGRAIGGMMAKPPTIPAEVPPYWGIYFAVSDVDAAVGRISELGGSVLMPPTDIEPGRFAVVTDPTGAIFQVLTMRAGLGD